MGHKAPGVERVKEPRRGIAKQSRQRPLLAEWRGDCCANGRTPNPAVYACNRLEWFKQAFLRCAIRGEYVTA